MIKVNLAKGRRNATNDKSGTLSNINLKQLDISNLLSFLKSSGDSGSSKKFELSGPIPKIIISLVMCWAIDDLLVGYKKEHLEQVNREVDLIEKEKTAVIAKLSKTKGYETVKKRLEQDEATVRTKLEVVNKLLENRNAPSKVMLQVAQTIPDEVWLNNLVVTNETVKLSGATPGYNQVSDFIKALNGTSQFGEIALSGIQESVTAQKEQRFQTFDLLAKRRPGN